MMWINTLSLALLLVAPVYADTTTLDLKENTPLDITIDPSARATLTLGKDPSNGSIKKSGDKIVYTPGADFVGSDTFSIKTCVTMSSTSAGIGPAGPRPRRDQEEGRELGRGRPPVCTEHDVAVDVQPTAEYPAFTTVSLNVKEESGKAEVEVLTAVSEPPPPPPSSESKNIVPGLDGTVDDTMRGQAGGDPHFKTWSGHKFDYHGECDLVLVDNPTFADGLGLKLHIRTTRVGYYSYIERTALQIGSDILEFGNNVDTFLFNKESNDAPKLTMGGGVFEVRRLRRAISVRLSKTSNAKIDFYARENGMPYFDIHADGTDIFAGSLGLLGEFETGKMIGRDGSTAITRPDHFAAEWQVGNTGSTEHVEPSLFQTIRAPQFPAGACIPPAKMLGKRLGDSHMMEKARAVCAAHNSGDVDNCVFDVMATRGIAAAEEIKME